jgi:hypothetical protein
MCFKTFFPGSALTKAGTDLACMCKLDCYVLIVSAFLLVDIKPDRKNSFSELSPPNWIENIAITSPKVHYMTIWLQMREIKQTILRLL